MKRFSITLAAIGLTASCGIFAALPVATDSSIVNVPQMSGGFVVGLQGYYLKPSTSNGYNNFTSIVSNNGNNGNNLQIKSVNPGLNWGWGADVGYIFPNTANDLNLSYFHLDTSDNATAFQSAIHPNQGLPIHASNSTGKAETTINQVNLAFGQAINIGSRLNLHPFAGLRYAEVDNDETNKSYSALFVLNGTEVVDSDFEGIGPLVGADASYSLGMGIGVVAHVDTALLIGSQNAKTTVTEVLPNNLGNGVNIYNIGNTREMVPVVDGKLGLNYTYLFNNASNSDLSLEVGYEASKYYNATEAVSDINDVVAVSHANIGLDGPYASLTLHA